MNEAEEIRGLEVEMVRLQRQLQYTRYQMNRLFAKSRAFDPELIEREVKLRHVFNGLAARVDLLELAIEEADSFEAVDQTDEALELVGANLTITEILWGGIDDDLGAVIPVDANDLDAVRTSFVWAQLRN